MSVKMKREMFRRGVRMTQRFDEGEGLSPFSETFAMPCPYPPGADGSRPVTVKRDGEHRYYDCLSPVVKPNGQAASINGPAPDVPDAIARPIPAGTVKRKR